MFTIKGFKTIIIVVAFIVIVKKQNKKIFLGLILDSAY